MRDIKVASRYAKSLLGIAIEQNKLEELYSDMQLINSVCINNRELVLLLKSPIVKSDKKQTVVTEVFGKQVSKISNTFISLILSKKRESILADIAVAFIDAYKVYNNIITAHVTSAVELSKSQKEGIIKVLKSEGKDKVELIEVVNPEIIGGMILRVGDKQVDESIKRKLVNLEMEFDDNPYVKEF
ncbi:MAG: ATP synthase F1 subunit delta [Vicingaceae bacterium]|nr:ATP synthase F1 subunit delta [Vicingaceae bacterium]